MQNTRRNKGDISELVLTCSSDCESVTVIHDRSDLDNNSLISLPIYDVHSIITTTADCQ